MERTAVKGTVKVYICQIIPTNNPLLAALLNRGCSKRDDNFCCRSVQLEIPTFFSVLNNVF